MTSPSVDIPTYPSTLPYPADTMVFTPVERRMMFGTRPTRVRAFEEGFRGTVKLTFRFKGAQAAIFRDWWENVLDNGFKTFTAEWPNWRGFAVALYRFRPNSVEWKCEGFEVFNVSVECAIRLAPRKRIGDTFVLLHLDQTTPFIDEVGRTVTDYSSGAITLDASGVFGNAAYFPGTDVGYLGHLDMPATAMALGARPFRFSVWAQGSTASGHPNFIFALSKDGGSIWPLVSLWGSSDGDLTSYSAEFSADQSGNSYVAALSVTIPSDLHPTWHWIQVGRSEDLTQLSISVDQNTPVSATVSSSLTFTPAPASARLAVGWTINNDTSDYPWRGPLDEFCGQFVPFDYSPMPPTAPFVIET